MCVRQFGCLLTCTYCLLIGITIHYDWYPLRTGTHTHAQEHAHTHTHTRAHTHTHTRADTLLRCRQASKQAGRQASKHARTHTHTHHTHTHHTPHTPHTQTQTQTHTHTHVTNDGASTCECENRKPMRCVDVLTDGTTNKSRGACAALGILRNYAQPAATPEAQMHYQRPASSNTLYKVAANQPGGQPAAPERKVEGLDIRGHPAAKLTTTKKINARISWARVPTGILFALHTTHDGH